MTSVLREKPQSAFRCVHSLEEFLASADDCIFYMHDGGGEGNPSRFLCDVSDGPYLVKLSKPVLYTASALATANEKNVCSRQRGMSTGGSLLLLTREGEVFCDSLEHERRAPDFFSGIQRNSWTINLPGDAVEVPGTRLYIELMRNHFGHALVDATARLWPFADPALADLHCLPVAGSFPPGRGGSEKSLAAHNVRFLSALGIELGNVLFASAKPLRFETLIVPGRISPFRGRSHRRFLDLMNTIGDGVVAAKPELPAPRSGAKVFVSRSRLTRGRQLAGGMENRLDELFGSYGFDIVHPQELDLAEQIAIIRQADVLAGPFGSALHLAAFRNSPGLRTFRIIPSYLENDVDTEVAKFSGGVLEDFIVPIDLPEDTPRRFQLEWTLSEGDLVRLEARLRDGVAGAAA